MRKIITICIIGLFALNVQAQPVKTLKLSDKELLDKIKGGWAGQTIGVVFGAPTEFKFTGTYIQDYQPIPWAEGYVKYWWEKKPGLFDDIYNDCTFVEAFDELGLDCSQEELAKRFAFADYHLAHANQAFHQCIQDVINFHSLHPDNWKDCWYFLQEKWNCDVGCPKGVFLNFNIDAKLNSAFVALAMLYGKGDFTNSVDIATRCGQDSDCNPSTVGGVLGVMYGYDKIPSFWLNPLKEVEDFTFEGTNMSLAKAYQMSFDQAKQLIVKTGGKVSGGEIEIPIKKADVLPLEQNFENTYPLYRERKDCFLTDTFEFDFNGNGFVIWGNICCTRSITPDYINRVSTRHIGSEVFGLAEPNDPYVAKVEIWIDGELDHVAALPMRNTDRKVEPAWKYLMKEGRHHVKMKWLNRKKDYIIRINDIMYYSEKKEHDRFYFNK